MIVHLELLDNPRLGANDFLSLSSHELNELLNAASANVENHLAVLSSDDISSKNKLINAARQLLEIIPGSGFIGLLDLCVSYGQKLDRFPNINQELIHLIQDHISSPDKLTFKYKIVDSAKCIHKWSEQVSQDSLMMRFLMSEFSSHVINWIEKSAAELHKQRNASRFQSEISSLTSLLPILSYASFAQAEPWRNILNLVNNAIISQWDIINLEARSCFIRLFDPNVCAKEKREPLSTELERFRIKEEKAILRDLINKAESKDPLFSSTLVRCCFSRNRESKDSIEFFVSAIGEIAVSFWSDIEIGMQSKILLFLASIKHPEIRNLPSAEADDFALLSNIELEQYYTATKRANYRQVLYVLRNVIQDRAWSTIEWLCINQPVGGTQQALFEVNLVNTCTLYGRIFFEKSVPLIVCDLIKLPLGDIEDIALQLKKLNFQHPAVADALKKRILSIDTSKQETTLCICQSYLSMYPYDSEIRKFVQSISLQILENDPSIYLLQEVMKTISIYDDTKLAKMIWDKLNSITDVKMIDAIRYRHLFEGALAEGLEIPLSAIERFEQYSKVDKSRIYQQSIFERQVGEILNEHIGITINQTNKRIGLYEVDFELSIDGSTYILECDGPSHFINNDSSLGLTPMEHRRQRTIQFLYKQLGKDITFIRISNNEWASAKNFEGRSKLVYSKLAGK